MVRLATADAIFCGTGVSPPTTTCHHAVPIRKLREQMHDRYDTFWSPSTTELEQLRRIEKDIVAARKEGAGPSAAN